ncbi:MAG: phosphate ABC transporter permease PstA [Planctomycetaceae bacterium]|nr:phosphate ABC transporter permease PstA [Planctomycetaceae bacterium]
MNSSRYQRQNVRSPFSNLMAHGEPWVWLMSGSLAIAITMVVGLLLFITARGSIHFWPRPLYEITKLNGEKFLGEVISRESQLENVLDDQTVDERVLVRAADPRTASTHYTWFDDKNITSIQRPQFATVVERFEGGRFHGFPVCLLKDGITTGNSPEVAWQQYQEISPTIQKRFREANRIDRLRRGDLQKRLRDARLALFNARLKHGENHPIVEYVKNEEQKISKEVTEISGLLDKKMAVLRKANSSWQFEFKTVNGQSATFPVEEIIQAWQPNNIGLFGMLHVYGARWWKFLSDNPREANSAGGVFPAICGTVSMTLIMALLVAPFGVLAALYLREYAADNSLTVAIRIAINNLAGVPSIVYGAFGLGFFCYGAGGWIDETFFSASLLADNQPTFGTGGLLWASLTLALLTLPVVIVATEEALAAVPNSMREGSYACGGSKWQTIRRIVLPRALPGIMTGLILAMARAAGEVAPLMLVGVKKVALDLPIDTSFPFIHPEREFMHLAYLVYDIGFQSSNSQAAKPMVFTITLLLVAIIAMLNIAAIYLRSKLKQRYALQEF